MVKGGYQIIDLKGYELRSGVSMQYKDLYSKIEGTDKVILLSGLSVDGVEYHDVFCEPIVGGSAYIFDVYGYEIVVSDIDIVTVNKKYVDFTEIYNFDLANQGEYEVPNYIYSKLDEAFEGKFCMIKSYYEGELSYGIMVASRPPYREITIIIGGHNIRRLTLTGINSVIIG